MYERGWHALGQGPLAAPRSTSLSTGNAQHDIPPASRHRAPASSLVLLATHAIEYRRQGNLR